MRINTSLKSGHLILRLTLRLGIRLDSSPIVHPAEEWLEGSFVQLFNHVQERRQNETLCDVGMHRVVA